ncbi:hypothetical protein Ancab_010222 [Ancistrocladus abbreviatus]
MNTLAARMHAVVSFACTVCALVRILPYQRDSCFPRATSLPFSQHHHHPSNQKVVPSKTPYADCRKKTLVSATFDECRRPNNCNREGRKPQLASINYQQPLMNAEGHLSSFIPISRVPRAAT